MGRTAAAALATLSVLWVVLILAAPLGLAHGSALLPAVIYEIGGLVCHQRPERSFHLAGVQLPVCARCFGLYASGAAGAVAASWAALPGRDAMGGRGAVVLAAAALPTALSVGLEWLGLYHSSGTGRAIAAIPLGVAAGWRVVRALRADLPLRRPIDQMRYHS